MIPLSIQFLLFQAAAQELRVEASRWSKKDNTIVSTVDCMAEHMEFLAIHHSKLSVVDPIRGTRLSYDATAKKGFIECAGGILKSALDLTSLARPLSSFCVDKRLQSQMNATLDRVVTMCQQLKILAAVKASSPEDDDADSTLITCAKNIIDSMNEALRQSEASSLRLPPEGKGLLIGSKGTVRFRRTLYRKTGKTALPSTPRRPSAYDKLKGY